MMKRLFFLLAGALVLLFSAALPPGADAQYFRYGQNKVQYGDHEWFFVQSKHFDVYYYEGGHELANYTAKTAEAAYKQISRLFQYEITERIPIIAYQSHNDFAVTNAIDLPTNAEGIGGVTELFKNRVAVPFTGDYRNYRRVVHHELVHAVLNDMFYGGSLQSIIRNNIQLDIPLWFNEGLAEYAALGWDTQSDMYIREAVLQDDLAPIRYLGGYFAYRGGQSVWDYIAEQYGSEKIADILQRSRASRSVESGVKAATGLSLEDLSERWQKTLKEIYFPEVAARENLDDIAKALVTRKEGYYNSSPALSPRGDRMVYVTTQGALFDVYLADTEDGKILGKLIDGQDNTSFESLRILTPGLAWSPDGRSIALAVKSGPSDAIAVVDVKTRRTRHYRIPGIDQIFSVAWNPVQDQIAFSAAVDGRSDLFVLDLTTGKTVNYTDDLFSDLEPSWSPDGRSLVFHSDRADYTALGRFRGGRHEMFDQDYSQFDVYLLRPGAPKAERLTTETTWDDRSAHFAGDESRVLFLSDRNGIYNLYEKNLVTGVERPLTDVTIGLTQLSVSADGKKAAVVSLKEGVPSIYVIRDPLERRLERDPLTPSVWAQRVRQNSAQPAPALALANATLRQSNPILRDAADGIDYQRDREEEPVLYASRETPRLVPFSQDGLDDASDSSSYGGVRVDFRNYVFSSAFDEENDRRVDAEDLEEMRPFDVDDNLDADGSYREQRYKLSFSSDLVYGTAGYDMLYGVQGITQMLFSDMLGNHQIFVATNLLIDLRNSDYILAYSYLPRRVDWQVSARHMSRILPDYNRGTYFRYRQYGGSISASYPIDKFRRIDADAGVLGVSQADIGDPVQMPQSRALFYPSVTYTVDVTTPGYLSPSGGRRFALSLSGSPGSFTGRQLRFMTLLADGRQYLSFGRNQYSFALRASAAASMGPDPQLFYAGGVQNWINRLFDPMNGFPIKDISDFVFATPVMPLRGYDINAQNGSYFGLFNAEFRFPLIAALLPGPIPIIPLYNIQGVAFFDGGSIWGGRGTDKRFNLLTTNEAGHRVVDDLLMSAGLGLRTIIFGYPIRFDYAWPMVTPQPDAGGLVSNGDSATRAGKGRLYISIGLDF